MLDEHTAASQSQLETVKYFEQYVQLYSDRGCTSTSVQMVLAGTVANTITYALKQTL